MPGFQLTRSHGNGEVCGKLDTYKVSGSHASRLAIGDVVVLTGTADTDGVAFVDAASDVDGQILGIIDSFIVNPSNLLTTGLEASVASSARVIIDPNAVYEVDVVNGPLLVANVGLNIAMDVTAATLSGGLTISNMAVDQDDLSSTAPYPFRIEAMLEDSAGVLGNRARVSVNNSSLNAGTIGV